MINKDHLMNCLVASDGFEVRQGNLQAKFDEVQLRLEETRTIIEFRYKNRTVTTKTSALAMHNGDQIAVTLDNGPGALPISLDVLE